MPYKVVQTMERGRLRLTAIPDQWEQNGILFWPKNKQEKLRRVEYSAPDQTWTSINCIVKRRNLRTFNDAEAEIDAMSDRSDTETDNENRLQTKKPTQTVQSGPLTKSYTEMAQQLSENYNQEASISAIIQPETTTPYKSDVPSNFSAINIVQSQEPNSFAEDINVGTENVDNQNILILNEAFPMQQMQEDIQIIKRDVKMIINHQNALFELQHKLLLKYSEFHTQFEEYIKLSSKFQVQNQNDAIKIIKNLNDLNDFEKNLSDPKLREEYRKSLRVLIKKNVGKGTSNAYYLIDHLFDREFLKECSWTGSSKESDTIKICFKAFQKMITFFFDIVHDSDETFTKADCEKFFKIVLKNARQRSESNKRSSTSRQRVKGKKTKKDINATSIIPADQPASVQHALSVERAEPLTEQNQNRLANVELLNQSPDSVAVQTKD